MKKIAFIALVVALISVGATYVHADNSISSDVQVTVSADANQDMADQLVTLQAAEKDPETGAIAKFFIHLKIRELKNKITLKTALK